MIGAVFKDALFVLAGFILPFITLGLIRKCKAGLQSRVGPPVLQPLFNTLKFMYKDQTISETTSWVFRASAAVSAGTIVLIACLVPWLSFKPAFPGDDLFLLLYLFALLRFMLVLSALDAGSPFGAFGASREAYLGMLAEPAMFITLAALGLIAHSSNLQQIFDLSQSSTIYDVPVWLAAAVAFFLCSVVDLSRMPIDDPTTHLELTMVSEALIIENSGKNLALVEFTHFLKMAVLYGLTSQCLLHAATYFVHLSQLAAGLLSVGLILILAVFTAVIESVAVKLRWRATPEFIGYALTMSLLAAGGALIGEIYARHGL